MSRIDPHNLDEMLFDYVEGNLDAHSREALQAYIEAHPELQVELQAWEQTRVEAPASDFPGMDNLLKPASGFGKAWLMRGIGLSSLLLLCLLGYFVFSGSHGAARVVGSHSPEPFTYNEEFHSSTVAEVNTSVENIDDILPLNGGHSYGPGLIPSTNSNMDGLDPGALKPSSMTFPETDLPTPKHRYLMRMKLVYMDALPADEDGMVGDGDLESPEETDRPDPIESREKDSSLEPMRTNKDIRVGDKIRKAKQEKKRKNRPGVID